MDDPSSSFDAAIWITGAAIVILLAMSAFFSGSETALTASSRAKLRAKADKGDGGAAAALALSEDSERLIGAILLGNNVVNILSASLATALFTRLLGSSGVAIATLVMTILVLIFSEVMPKSYAISAPEKVASLVARPIRVLTILLSPIVTVVRAIVRGILRIFGLRTDPGTHMFSIEEEIAGALSIGHAQGSVHKEDRDRLLGALDLGNRTVEEIMRHRSEIQMIDAEMPPEKILDTVLASPHTRLPVFRDERENIVGVVHAKDLLRAVNRAMREAGDSTAAQRFDIMSVAMPPYFVPETSALDEQMREFLKRRTHFALVVDEYGSLRGLLTLEDILEEIVGEIADEHDTEADQTLKPNAQGDYLVDGGMTIRDLNRQLDWTLPDDEANTVAGLVIHMAQSIPEQGQVFSFHGYRFEVVTRRENRITRLRVRPLAPTRPQDE
ncbi:HlyC/CorC family transporter [Paracoccus sp. 1_MG-2023]|uniref:HlyC/CorC family transporter n=1 Tax=unclassified Paracoccus (in: a-proteobacteria) TaxID=2688777 RepID=UPI001C081E73|nr:MULTISPECIES: HlyC/CorC family transporter [unclassified Paracoccus (in: a-proteobacteria)]MBU2958514.1 HlyC/CorC family transporter [Paracoccus sp. C2R09]MDO6668501.1 HlyC/CorC family transporter [Paracoccus sp. 1_MG-2023]